MKQKSGSERLRELCRRQKLQHTLDHYIRACRESGNEEETSEGGGKRKRSGQPAGRFPNLAGYCRAQGISLSELDTMSKEFPDALALLYTTLEDEALNSGLPPPILSAYLKKRMGYDREDTPSEEPLRIQFEHDVYRDGQ